MGTEVARDVLCLAAPSSGSDNPDGALAWTRFSLNGMLADSRDEFLTVAEVAQLLRLNQQTVRNWIDQGSLPEIRVGARRVRIPRADLDAFLMEASGANATNGAQDAPEAEAQSASDSRAEFGRVLDRARGVLDGGSDQELAEALRELVDSRESSSSDRTETHATAALKSAWIAIAVVSAADEDRRHRDDERRRVPASRGQATQHVRPLDWERPRTSVPRPPQSALFDCEQLLSAGSRETTENLTLGESTCGDGASVPAVTIPISANGHARESGTTVDCGIDCRH